MVDAGWWVGMASNVVNYGTAAKVFGSILSFKCDTAFAGLGKDSESWRTVGCVDVCKAF
jgi:hypothetical protein